MTIPRLLPLRLRPVLFAAGVFLLLSLLTRVVLALRPDVPFGGVLEFGGAFARGLLFDLSATAYALTPLLLWLALAPSRLARTRLYRAGSVAAVATACFLALFLAVSEWIFWDEFAGRFNFIAVDYLLYTHEVIGNIWQSYPVGRILLGLAAIALAVTVLARRALWRWSGAPLGWRATVAVLAVHTVLLAGITQFVSSDLKAFSARDASNELAGNGLYDFFAANRRNELSYDRFYRTLPLADAMQTVRKAFGAAIWTDHQQDSIERHEHRHAKERRLNVVLVSVESLGAEFLGAYGDTRGLTPNLDRLAKESLWFSRVYATGNRTVRGLEALALALPPTPGQSIVRRPDNEKLFSLGSVFEDKGYGVLFAYGGYGYFDNMNAFFDANDYRVVDRRSIPKEKIAFENVWGVADEHLFDQVIEEMDRERRTHPERPFFAHVMTTTNHRPYTYPAGRIDIPPGSGRDGAVKYSDWALGQLIERARARPWFEDTVFVLTADHGASARGTSRIPLEKYLIPLFVYSPKHVAPQRVDRLMSQIDIAPTLLGLLDFDHYTKFLGRDVLRAGTDTDRAFVANYQTLGYLKGDELVVLHPKQRVETFRIRDHRYEAVVANPVRVAEAIAFYQVASHVFRNGLYRDEEQIPPEVRAKTARPLVSARLAR